MLRNPVFKLTPFKLTLLNLNEKDYIMPICQFLEHQIANSDYGFSGLSGSTTQNIETANKYIVNGKFLVLELYFYWNDINIGDLNINSPRNKFEILSTLIAYTFDIFMLSETKLDDSFYFSAAFNKGFFVPHILDCNNKGGGKLLDVRETLIILPLKKYSLSSNIEAKFFELNPRRKNGSLLRCSYNPHYSNSRTFKRTYQDYTVLFQNLLQFFANRTL